VPCDTVPDLDRYHCSTSDVSMLSKAARSKERQSRSSMYQNAAADHDSQTSSSTQLETARALLLLGNNEAGILSGSIVMRCAQTYRPAELRFERSARFVKRVTFAINRCVRENLHSWRWACQSRLAAKLCCMRSISGSVARPSRLLRIPQLCEAGPTLTKRFAQRFGIAHSLKNQEFWSEEATAWQD
jgi:hypothetical protein